MIGALRRYLPPWVHEAAVEPTQAPAAGPAFAAPCRIEMPTLRPRYCDGCRASGEVEIWFVGDLRLCEPCARAQRPDLLDELHLVTGGRP